MSLNIGNIQSQSVQRVVNGVNDSARKLRSAQKQESSEVTPSHSVNQQEVTDLKYVMRYIDSSDGSELGAIEAELDRAYQAISANAEKGQSASRSLNIERFKPRIQDAGKATEVLDRIKNLLVEGGERFMMAQANLSTDRAVELLF